MEEDAAFKLRDARLCRRWWPLDILVNNAGGSRRLPVDAAEERWVEAMTLNFTRPRQLAHALLPKMIENRWGRIINITGKSEPDTLTLPSPPKPASMPGPRACRARSGNTASR